MQALSSQKAGMQALHIIDFPAEPLLSFLVMKVKTTLAKRPSQASQ